MIDLSIVIASWNTRELLQRCLQSIYGTAGDLDFEVFVVDNASSDDSPTMIRDQFPQVQLMENDKNLGFACANNQAIRHSRGRYVLLLNSDTEVQPMTLQLLVKALDAHPQAGAAGPMMLNPDGTFQNSYGELPSVLAEICGPYLFDFITKPWGGLGRILSSRAEINPEVIETDRVSFACTLIRREALDQIGGLDESFLFYSEDYDWFKRLKDAGWNVIFCSRPQVKHYWGASSRQKSEWSIQQLYASKRQYYLKHYGQTAEWFLRAGLTVRFALKWMLAVLSYPIRSDQARCQAKLEWNLARTMLSPLRRKSAIAS